MADSEEGEGDRVRQIVREGIANMSSSQNSAQNTYARAQGLTRNAASAYTAEIAELRMQGSQQQRETATRSGHGLNSSSSSAVNRHHHLQRTGPHGFGLQPSLPGAVSTTPAIFSGSYGKRKTQPGHVWRLQPEKMPKQKPDKLIYAWLLHCPEQRALLY